MSVAPSPVYANPIGPGLVQGRVDQGIDYNGTGPLYALGSGVIVNTFNSGWGPPNGEDPGAFIALKLDAPPDPSRSVFYYAEGVNPAVQVGQRVDAGQLVGQANGNGIEVGWGSAANIGQALAGQLGEFTGNNATTEGENALAFIKSVAGGGQPQPAQLTSSSGGKPASSGSSCVVSFPGVLFGLGSFCILTTANLKAIRSALLVAAGSGGMIVGLVLLGVGGLAGTSVGRGVTQVVGRIPL